MLFAVLATVLLCTPTGAAAAPKGPYVAPAAPITCAGRVDLVATSSSGGAISYVWICPATATGDMQVWFEVCDARADGHHAEGVYASFNTSLHRFVFGPPLVAVHGFNSCATLVPTFDFVSGVPSGSEYNVFAGTYEGHRQIDDTGASQPFTVGG
jgi:hypothetical protein